MRKIMALLTAIMMILACCSASAEVEFKAFPELVEDFSKAVDPTAPLKTLYSGAYRMDCGENGRTVVVYLGKEYSQTQGFVMLVPASGMTAAQVLEEGGWGAIADEHNLYLMILENENEWDTAADGADMAYVKEAMKLADTRSYWRQPEGRLYFVTYGDASDFAMECFHDGELNGYAGIVTFGDLTVDAEQTANGADTEMPVWMFVSELNTNEIGVLDYFKAQNGSAKEFYSNEYADEIYFPNQHTTDLLLNDQPMSQVRLTVTEDAAALNADRAAAVYAFLHEGTREVGYGAKAMRYTHEVSDWGATVESIVVDGITRSWIQYVPSTLINTSEGKAPLLVAIHGAALNGEYFAERTEYIKLAEEYGFIIVFPTGSLTKGITPAWTTNPTEENWNDYKFISGMLDVVKANLPVDESRIYVYGHSMGGLFTQYLVRELDGTFAAAFGTGCAFRYPTESDHAYDTPFSIMVGNKDFQSPHGIDNEKLRACMNYWVEYNHCGTIDDLDGAYRMGRFSVYTWENDDRIPVVQYFHAEDMPHTATLDGGILMINWLSQFCRNADGSIGYRTGSYGVIQ